ncbi:MAG: hypothetical protein HZC41_05085 [Chloroflexi bacterium]|nr:hypothetical protein [Chloroflexota bacterium]
MRRLVCLLLFGLCFNIVAARAQDDNIIPSDDPPYPCPYTSGAYYQPNLFPRYDINSNSLTLVDMTTGETVRVLDTIAEPNIRLINWSPDCRYLSGAVGEIRASSPVRFDWLGYENYVSWYSRDIVLWDALNGGRVQSFINPGKRIFRLKTPVVWSPDSQYALILGGCPSLYYDCAIERERYDFLWIASNNSAARFEQLPSGESIRGRSERFIRFIPNMARFGQEYWDIFRGWLWGSAPGGVAIYSLADGSLVTFLKNRACERCQWGAESRFVFSSDGQKVTLYSIAQRGTVGAITVYDLATMTGTEVNVEGLAAPYIPFADYHPVALSPDNRYLAVGYDAIRVWDLQNLPEAVEDRLPIYRHGGPTARIWSVRFAAPGVIETTSEEGTQRWDLHTGVYIP